MRLFYAYEFDESNSRNRTAGAVDGVTIEYGERVFRETIDRCTCPQRYNEIPTCMECLKLETVIDLRDVNELTGQT